ncbi:MAG TPA: L,D-transpeptidase family protein [Anaerolineales bacterium]|nr:L,D-transpeptidase family protein [Anaerolineales bacterium]
MNANFVQARDYILRARESLRRGDKVTARMLSERAALLAPEMEDAWLILAASDPNPEDALAYALKAREINPKSSRARKGVDWAEERLNQTQAGRTGVEHHRNEAPTPHIESIPIPIQRPLRSEGPQVELKSNPRVWMYGSTIGLLICIVFAFAAWSAANNPALADLVDSAPAPTQEKLWAQVEFAKPSVTPIDANAFAQAVDTPEPNLVVPETGAEVPTSTPTPVPSDAPTLAPASTETPAVLAMDIVADTPTSEYIAPTKAPGAPPVASGSTSTGGVRWIDVDLTNQMVYAYEGDTIVNSFVVSTGTWMTPTVTGKYKIWIKLKKTNMSGPGYYLADVPYVMYFHKGYGLHGTYWHNNFGTPMSHGCVNLSISDAEWLYNWAFEGTVVNVHH